MSHERLEDRFVHALVLQSYAIVGLKCKCVSATLCMEAFTFSGNVARQNVKLIAFLILTQMLSFFH